MKNALLFLLLSIFGNAQQFDDLDSLQFAKTVDQLILDTGKNYTLKDQGETTIGYFFKYQDENKNVLLINYETYMKGEKPDLEIKGEKKWKIKLLMGNNYLSLFPIWQKYIDSKADKEAIADKGSARSQKNIRYYFKKDSDNFWNIRL